MIKRVTRLLTFLLSRININSNDYQEGNSELRQAAGSAFVIFVGAPDI
jgi:hypothetical protein